MKYLYIQTNKDWNTENKFKYGFTTNPKNRLTSEQHSHKSSYLALYECIETDNYIYRKKYKEYDKIISRLHNIKDNDINQEALENGIDLYKLIEIKKYLIYEKGGGTEFIRTNEAIELLDDIFINVFKDIGINTRKLSKDEINDINNYNDNYDNDDNDNDDKEIKNNKIKLRDYQINIIQNGFKKLLEINKFYLELATGAGKSTIIYYILNYIILNNKDNYYTIIIFTPRINISSQNINDKYIKILKKQFNIYDNKKIRRIRTFNNNSYNLISCCIQSFQFIYDKIISKFDIKNIIIWFDEAHYTIENWIKPNNHYKQFYLTDNEIIIYRLFTSASPNKEIVKNNINLFGEMYSPITVRNLIKDKWLAPIKPLIMDFTEIIINNDDNDDNNNDNNNDINIDNINTNSNKYYYYTNTILNTFQIKNKRIGLNFHNSCKNAIFAFFSHYKKFINTKTNIKPYLLISDEIKNNKILELLDNNYKYLLNFQHFHDENNNAIAYIVNMYNMGYDNYKIDFLSFADPKLSNKDIIQSIGRGIRPDGLGLEGRNLNKINDIIIPIYNNEEETDKYIKFTKIKEILQYLIYDIGLDIKDIKIYNKSPLNSHLNSYNDCCCDEELEESKIIANIIKWDIEPTAEKWTIKRIITHLMNNKIHNYNDYLVYISLEENKELNLPLDLFKTYSNFNFNDTYKSSPYYNRDECIEAIKKYKNDFIDNDDIDKNDNNDIIKFLNGIDKKIPNFILWYYYGGLIKDFILFI
jgi:superfamily II DNA or RNA helicase